MGDSIENYNLDTMKAELQQALRIQDWDIDFVLESKDAFYRIFENDNTKGCCTRDQKENTAEVSINKDHPDHLNPTSESVLVQGWLPTVVHEFCHIFLDPYDAITQSIASRIPGEEGEHLMSELNVVKESTVNKIARLYLSTIDIPAFLDRHRKDEANGNTTETAE